MFGGFNESLLMLLKSLLQVLSKANVEFVITQAMEDVSVVHHI
jgi:hypothetical protein